MSSRGVLALSPQMSTPSVGHHRQAGGGYLPQEVAQGLTIHQPLSVRQRSRVKRIPGGSQAKDVDVAFSWQFAAGPDHEEGFDWPVPVPCSLAKPPPQDLPRDKAAAAGAAPPA